MAWWCCKQHSCLTAPGLTSMPFILDMHISDQILHFVKCASVQVNEKLSNYLLFPVIELVYTISWFPCEWLIMILCRVLCDHDNDSKIQNNLYRCQPTSAERCKLSSTPQTSFHAWPVTVCQQWTECSRQTEKWKKTCTRNNSNENGQRQHF